jgi:hypothetical protein
MARVAFEAERASVRNGHARRGRTPVSLDVLRHHLDSLTDERADCKSSQRDSLGENIEAYGPRFFLESQTAKRGDRPLASIKSRKSWLR